jgi:hypothetical protein
MTGSDYFGELKRDSEIREEHPKIELGARRASCLVPQTGNIEVCGLVFSVFAIMGKIAGGAGCRGPSGDCKGATGATHTNTHKLGCHCCSNACSTCHFRFPPRQTRQLGAPHLPLHQLLACRMTSPATASCHDHGFLKPRKDCVEHVPSHTCFPLIMVSSST